MDYPGLSSDTAWKHHADMNCDTYTNSLDLDPFVMRLTNPPKYYLYFPDCEVCPGAEGLMAVGAGEGALMAFDEPRCQTDHGAIAGSDDGGLLCAPCTDSRPACAPGNRSPLPARTNPASLPPACCIDVRAFCSRRSNCCNCWTKEGRAVGSPCG